MKTKWKIIAALAVILLPGVLTVAVADEDPPKREVISGLGWQKSSCTIRKVYMDPIKFQIDVNVDATQNIVGNLTIDTQVRMIDCCSFCGEEHAWCNFDGDHEGC